MPTVGSIQAKIGVDLTGFQRDLDRAQRQFQTAGRAQVTTGRQTAESLARAFEASNRRIERDFARLTAASEREAVRRRTTIEREQNRAIAANVRALERQAREEARLTAAVEREANRQAAARQRAIAGALRSVGGAIGGGLGAVSGGIGQLGDRMVGALNRVAQAGIRAGLVLSGVGAAGFIAIAKAGVDMNVSLQQATAALTQITGSGRTASQFIAALRKESETSALTFKELIPLGQQLAAVYGPGGIGKVIPTLRAFGDAGALLGVGGEGVSRALLGFRQLLSRDKPSQEDLNQVGENLPGFDVKGILKRAFGAADTETLQAAGVTGAQVGAALLAGMQRAFGGAQLRAAGSIPILLSNIADAFNNLAATLTTRFTPMLAKALQGLMAFMQGIASNEKLLAALAIPFDVLGGILIKLTAKLPELAMWMEKTFTRKNVIEGITNIGAALLTAFDLGARAVNAFQAGVGWLQQNVPILWQQMLSGVSQAQSAMGGLVGSLQQIAGLLEKISGLMGRIPGMGGGGGGSNLPSLGTAGFAPSGGGSRKPPWVQAFLNAFDQAVFPGRAQAMGFARAALGEPARTMGAPAGPRQHMGPPASLMSKQPGFFGTVGAAFGATSIQGSFAANQARMRGFLGGVLGPEGPTVPGNQPPYLQLYRENVPGNIRMHQPLWPNGGVATDTRSPFEIWKGQVGTMSPFERWNRERPRTQVEQWQAARGQQSARGGLGEDAAAYFTRIPMPYFLNNFDKKNPFFKDKKQQGVKFVDPLGEQPDIFDFQKREFFDATQLFKAEKAEDKEADMQRRQDERDRKAFEANRQRELKARRGNVNNFTINLGKLGLGDIFRDPQARKQFHDELDRFLNQRSQQMNPAPYGF